MAVRFRPTSLRHGISHERATYVIEHCPQPLYSDDLREEDLVVFLGPDASGVPLEVVAVELSDGDLLVIHAMRLRQKYRRAYRQVMRWRER